MEKKEKDREEERHGSIGGEERDSQSFYLFLYAFLLFFVLFIWCILVPSDFLLC